MRRPAYVNISVDLKFCLKVIKRIRTTSRWPLQDFRCKGDELGTPVCKLALHQGVQSRTSHHHLWLWLGRYWLQRLRIPQAKAEDEAKVDGESVASSSQSASTWRGCRGFWDLLLHISRVTLQQETREN